MLLAWRLIHRIVPAGRMPGMNPGASGVSFAHHQRFDEFFDFFLSELRNIAPSARPVALAYLSAVGLLRRCCFFRAGGAGGGGGWLAGGAAGYACW